MLRSANKLALTVAAAVAIATGAIPALAASGEVVAMSVPNRFEPSMIEIDPGDTVTFRNGGGFHNVVWQDPDGEKRPVGEASFVTWQVERTYDESGTFSFYCDPHRSQGMVGRVVVRSSDDGGGEQAPTGGGEQDPTASGQQDTTAPRVAGLAPRGRQTSRRVRLGFRASEAGTAKLYIDRRASPARKARGSARRRKARRSAPRFRRYAVHRLTARRGLNRLTLRKLGKRPIRPGSYRVKLRLSDAAGNRSRLQRTSFRVR